MSVQGLTLLFFYPSDISSDTIKITVSDGELSASQTISVTVNQVYDTPVVNINSPENGSKVNGTVIVSGSVIEQDYSVILVQIRIDDGEWITHCI